MTRRRRRFLLATHLICSVGWIGAVIVYLALGLASLRHSPERVRASWIAMEIIGWSIIVPMALLALATGIILAMGSRWGLGLIRHYWIVFSLGLTLVATAVLLVHMPSVSLTTRLVLTADPADVTRLDGDLLHPALGLVVLLAIHLLKVYKPRGLTPLGRRRLARVSDNRIPPR